MAVWRTKAYAAFGLKPGDYSYGSGRLQLFGDMVEWSRRALAEGNGKLLDQIAEYVTWAAGQDSAVLDSAVDLGFFLPVFRDVALCSALKDRFPQTLFAEKWQTLMME
jgi:hypothetical protein